MLFPAFANRLQSSNGKTLTSVLASRHNLTAETWHRYGREESQLALGYHEQAFSQKGGQHPWIRTSEGFLVAAVDKGTCARANARLTNINLFLY
jgi:hypothetical protein